MVPRSAPLAFRFASRHAPDMSTESPDATAPGYWQLVADKLQRVPSLLEMARQNILRWKSHGQSAPHRLDEWDRLLREAQADREGLNRLLAVLLGSDEHSERMREFNPFPGVLTREERRRARELCGYRH